MKTFFVIFILLSALVYSQAAVVQSLGSRIECFQQAQNRVYEEKIRQKVEALRDQLKVGNPDKNIPPLDPYVIEDMDMSLNSSAAKLNWTLAGNVAGLMSWELTKIKFSLLSRKATFEITFPQIVGRGSYSINGTIIQVVPLYGSGNFDVTARNLIVNGSAKIDIIKLSISTLNLGISLEKLDFDVKGLMDDPALSFLLSQMISDSVPDLIQTFQRPLVNYLSTLILKAVNKRSQQNPQEYQMMFQPELVDSRMIAMQCGGY